ncbi:MAG: hypothetical protein R8G66_01560 [Cytophagales bacterium]|nr:hypothetical protein [Cytophagales bacterium]
MRNLLLTSMLFVVGCSMKFYPSINANRSIHEFNSYYLNDSLQISAVFPGDCELRQDSLSQYVKRVRSLKNHSFKGLEPAWYLLHGHTDFAPYYQFVMLQLPKETIDPSDEHWEQVSDYFLQRFETNGALAMMKMTPLHDYLLIGFTDRSKLSNMSADFEGIIKSIETDENYEPHVPESPFTLLFEKLNEASAGKYLDVITTLSSRADNYQTNRQQQLYLQSILTATSLVIDHPWYDSLENSYEQHWRSNLDSLFYQDPWEADQLEGALTVIADTAQVVMLNELHWDRSHRMSLMRWLPLFKEQGFKYLAMEAIWQKDSLLNDRGYPVDSSGFYVKEPSLGHVIRKASELGFDLIAYESLPSQEREFGQASNLYQATIAKDSEAKILVYAGLGHIDENGNRMAAQLKENFGIDPVTIDQFYLTLHEPLQPILSASSNMKPHRSITTDFYMGVPTPTNYSWPDAKSIDIEVQPSAIPTPIREGDTMLTMLYVLDEWQSAKYAAIPLYNHWGINTTYSLTPGKYYWQVVNAYGDVLSSETKVVK